MTEPTWNFDKMLKGLPNLNTVSGVPDQSVSWHMFDISHNYINDRINWTDNVIELKDSKQMICYSFTYYGEFKEYTPIADIKESNGGVIDVDSIRSYFRDHAFTQIFNSPDCGTEGEVLDMCSLTPESFIIMPMYETARVMYVALLNINKAYAEYLSSIYSSADGYVAKFFNLVDVTYGLQTHMNITGVKHATSFNLFKSLYTSNVAKYSKTGSNTGLNYKFDANKLILNDNCEIPLILLFNGYNYFPRFQVVWSTDKIFLNLPGVMPPNNDSLLSANKVLKAGHVNKNKDSDKNDEWEPKIPRVMAQNTIVNKSKQKPVTDWLRDYKKYCGSETTQYTSMTKLLCSMNRLQLEVRDYIA
jgi:hypothetical protein